MTNFSDLSPDHKRTLLANIHSNSIALTAIDAMLGKPEYAQAIWKKSYDTIAAMSESEVEELIAELDVEVSPFCRPGEIAVVKRKRNAEN